MFSKSYRCDMGNLLVYVALLGSKSFCFDDSVKGSYFCCIFNLLDLSSNNDFGYNGHLLHFLWWTCKFISLWTVDQLAQQHSQTCGHIGAALQETQKKTRGHILFHSILNGFSFRPFFLMGKKFICIFFSGDSLWYILLFHLIRAFGYSSEDVQMVIETMASQGKEPTFCMGDDIPLAVLSQKPHMIYDYFKQRFAQVC